MKSAQFLLGASVALALALAGCGGPSCSDKGKCKNDTTSLSSVLPTCQKISDGVCGGQLKDYIGCVEDNETCDADGNGTVATDRCTSQFNSLEQCCLKTPSACPAQ